MKRFFVFCLAIVLALPCLLLQGCDKPSENLDNFLAPSLKASDLSIDDFQWETNKAKHNGNDCYSFSLTNNSDYDILSVQFTYKVRDDVTDDELAIYSDFMADHEGYIEATDSPRDIILRGNKDVLVPKGGKFTGLLLAVGYKNWVWYDAPTTEQFNLMEPKELQIGIVGKNNTLYIAYYNFVDKTWILDNSTKPVDTWSNKEIARKINRPADTHHIIATDKEDELKVYAFGITSDEYEQYISDIIASGFTEEYRSSSTFNGTHADGYEVDLYYYEGEDRLRITIRKDT